jgi:uncharacterized protein YndB with AHSA1/START domain
VEQNDGRDAEHGCSTPRRRPAGTISGVHKEVSPPSRLVHTELMEMGPGAGPCGQDDPGGEPWEDVATLELTESRGRTHLKMTLLFPSKKARDAALASGMEHGVAANYDALEREVTALEADASAPAALSRAPRARQEGEQA